MGTNDEGNERIDKKGTKSFPYPQKTVHLFSPHSKLSQANSHIHTSVNSFKSFRVFNGKAELLLELMVTTVRWQVDAVEAEGDDKKNM